MTFAIVKGQNSLKAMQYIQNIFFAAYVPKVVVIINIAVIEVADVTAVIFVTTVYVEFFVVLLIATVAAPGVSAWYN